MARLVLSLAALVLLGAAAPARAQSLTWPKGETAGSIPNQLQSSKLQGYGVLNGTGIDASKIQGYAVLNPCSECVSKLQSYAVLSGSASTGVVALPLVGVGN